MDKVVNLQFMYKMITKVWSNRLVPLLCSLNWCGCHLTRLQTSRKLQTSQPVIHAQLHKQRERGNCIFPVCNLRLNL
jgi:hypothetical protein